MVLVKKKSKAGKIILIIVAVVILLLVVGAWYVMASPTVKAYLKIEEGSVQVNQGSGYAAAVDEMELRQTDSVKTEANSRASIVFYEGAIVSLEPNTEVIIASLSQDITKVEQPKGSTWNKFMALSGIDEMTVETPQTVATIRGTSYEINLDSAYVLEGTVEVTIGGQTFSVGKFEKVVMEDGVPVKKPFDEADYARFRDKIQRHIDVLKSMRQKELDKKAGLVESLTKQFGIEDFDAELENADRGEFDLDEIEAAIPVKVATVSKVRGLTEEIIDEMKLLDELQG